MMALGDKSVSAIFQLTDSTTFTDEAKKLNLSFSLPSPGVTPFPPYLSLSPFTDIHLVYPSLSIATAAAAVGKSLEDGAPSVMIFCSAEQ